MTEVLVQKRALWVANSAEKNDDTWIDCAANDKSIWNVMGFKTYNSIAATPVDTCDWLPPIVGEGEVEF